MPATFGLELVVSRRNRACRWNSNHRHPTPPSTYGFNLSAPLGRTPKEIIRALLAPPHARQLGWFREWKQRQLGRRRRQPTGTPLCCHGGRHGPDPRNVRDSLAPPTLQRCTGGIPRDTDAPRSATAGRVVSIAYDCMRRRVRARKHGRSAFVWARATEGAWGDRRDERRAGCCSDWRRSEKASRPRRRGRWRWKKAWRSSCSRCRRT
jgi:hypothetical protein